MELFETEELMCAVVCDVLESDEVELLTGELELAVVDLLVVERRERLEDPVAEGSIVV